jgi:hypothetical protein
MAVIVRENRNDPQNRRSVDSGDRQGAASQRLPDRAYLDFNVISEPIQTLHQLLFGKI